MLSPSFSKIDSLDHGQQPLMGNSIGMSSARRLTKNTTMIAEIGVGTKVSCAPPSEPDWQISCIRLSSWWLSFKKIGKPQRTLVLRNTSPPRRSRYLAIGVDRYL